MTSEASEPGPGYWRCRRCGRSWFLRRCSVCSLVSHVHGAQQWHQLWQCVWCREANVGFTRFGDPAAATVADLAADVERYHLTFSPAEPAAAAETQPLTRPARQPIPVVGMSAPREASTRVDGEMPLLLGPGPLPPGRAPAAPGRPLRLAAILALAVTMAVVAALLVVRAVQARSAVDPGGPGGRAGLGGPLTPGGPGTPDGSGSLDSPGAPGGSRAVLVSAGPVSTVKLQGVPGQLTVTRTGSRQVTLSGQLHWHGHPPLVVTRYNQVTHVLRLSYRCAPASPCTENYRLAVPGGTATVLHQSSGHLMLAGLAGPLQLTGGSVDVSATGLRTPRLTAQISSGHLTASFAQPPGQLTITLISAQATLRLPAGALYRVAQQVSAGYVRVGIPHAAAAPHTVTAQVTSGELELLPS